MPLASEWAILVLLWLFVGTYVWDFNLVRFKSMSKYEQGSEGAEERMIDTHEILEGLEM